MITINLKIDHNHIKVPKSQKINGTILTFIGLSDCSFALVVMIYNWLTSQWTEYTEVATSAEVYDTIEIKCVKVVRDEKTKIYAMMQRNSDENT